MKTPEESSARRSVRISRFKLERDDGSEEEKIDHHNNEKEELKISIGNILKEKKVIKN